MNKYLDKMILISERAETNKSDRLEKLYALLLLFTAMRHDDCDFNQIVKLTYYPKSYKDADDIVKSFCKAVGLMPFEIRKKTRERFIVGQRQRLQALLSYNTKLSLTGVGRIVGGQDHATVLHSKKTVRNLCCTDKNYKKEYENIAIGLGLKYK